MKKLISIAALAVTFGLALAQESTIQNVSVAAKGDDVRAVLHTIFTQTKKNYVLDPGVRFVLYLNLSDIEFEEALQLICKNAALKFEVQNGIYFIGKAPAKPATLPAASTEKPVPKPEVKPVVKPEVKPTATKPPQAKADPKPTATKTPIVKTTSESGIPLKTKQDSPLQRKITTRLAKVDIRELFADLGRQTSTTITVSQSVPAYKLDAYLNQTSLKFALDSICKAAGLKYELVDSKISISKVGEPAKTGK